MYSTHNEGKYVAAERLIRRLKTKMCKYITSVSKNVYIDKLDDIGNKYSNTYNTIKMKSSNVKSRTYIDFGLEDNDKGPKFEVGDFKRILVYQNSFVKSYTQNWCKEVFLIKRLENAMA